MPAWSALAATAAVSVFFGSGGEAMDQVHSAAAPPLQQPFICRTQESGLGQPLVDNHEGIGHPVFDNVTRDVVGFSQYCAITPRTQLFYFTGSRYKPYEAGSRPADLQAVVQVEVGTINRFLYTIAMPVPRERWNHKLVYWLRGGVGIGHQQGKAMWFNDGLSSSERELLPKILAQGYAVVSSSGNETAVHYNMRLSAQTAALTKAHFVAAYGKPLFTIGVGGSGGAVQQYLFAQNSPGLLDGGVPIQSYPDMITQTIPISDCPLLGQYFKDEVARDPASPWATWSRQAWIEGMNASDTVRNASFGGMGTTECINGWRMAMPTVLNPVYKDARFDMAARGYGYPPDVFANVKWTHWNDLAEIYGVDARGHAPVPIDNVGVQYGLAALARGQIGVDEFLRINACVGGWKEQGEFVNWEATDNPFDVQNMLRSASCRDPAGTPAPRRAGSAESVRKAIAGGQVFTGQRLGIPMIDLRPYLEPELNMHNARQAFSVRARLRDGGPDAVHQVIWFTHAQSDLAASVMQAIGVIDRYLADGVAPPEFVDQCVDAKGERISAGAHAWDGVLDALPAGACTTAYPVYSSPRMVAGDSIKGDVFKCALKPVARALHDGTYRAGLAFTPAQAAWLARIFPQGVCDFRPGEGPRATAAALPAQ
ncbi:MAG: DUF6351 family protein [Pseudomonadota bacterium]